MVGNKTFIMISAVARLIVGVKLQQFVDLEVVDDTCVNKIDLFQKGHARKKLFHHDSDTV